MAEMSEAIRTTLERHGKTLSDIPTPTLADFAEIVAAYLSDLRGELERRK